MAQLLDIFAFVSVLLRGMTLAFEALTIGGAIFMLAIVRKTTSTGLLRWLILFSTLLAVTQILFVGANSAILMNSAELTWEDVRGAGYCVAGAMIVAGAVVIAGFARSQWSKLAWPAGCLLILCGTVMTSHAAARLEHRSELAFLTLVHHAAGDAWIGALPYLLWALRENPNREVAQSITSRFSRLAMTAVPTLFVAGAAMGFLYVGNRSALTGTTYGIMLSSKVMLTTLIVLLGALNLRIVRAIRAGASPRLIPLRRFAEAEIGIGFTVILAAASLTSSPPAIDVNTGRVTITEIAERMKPVWPRMRTPALGELSPVTLLRPPVAASVPGSFVPGQQAQPITSADIAWSEYNHHWAGLIVLAAGVLSLLSRRYSWAKHWPLVFLGLAVFLFLRADAENWPLGPRGILGELSSGGSGTAPAFRRIDHRIRDVRVGRSSWTHFPQRCGLVFPLVCAVGGALLLSHSHSLGNVKESFLAELSHTALAILAVMAGWSRWLEIRLSQNRTRILAWVWPLCFVLIGALLMNYREA